MLVTIENDYLAVTCDTLGAEIVSAKNKKDNTEYIWFGAENFWERHAIIPFPICGRLFSGKYTYEGKSYELGCHGIAPNSEFKAEETADDEMVFTLNANEETKKVYPFDFVLKIAYKLDGKTVKSRCTIENPDGKNTLIAGIGAHPGFNVPFKKGTEFEDYRLDFGAGRGELAKCVLSETCFMTGKTEKYPLEDGRYITLNHRLFDHDAIFFDNKLGEVTLECGKSKITVKSAQAKYWGLWHTTLSDAPFVCIEPWMSIPGTDGVVDDFENKAAMQHIAPKDSFTLDWSIEFDV